MRTITKTLAMLAMVIALGATLTISAQADIVIDFDVLGPQGSITYAVGTNPLIGSNIPINWVAGLDTPAHSNSYPITGGLLNFQTGNFVSYDASLKTWSFNGGGSIEISGTVKDGTTVVASGPLLYDGTFQTANVFASGSRFFIALAIFSDYKNADLLTFFGVPWAIDQSLDGSLNIQFLGTGANGGTISSTSIVSGDVANSFVPVPSTLLLLGSGILGLVGLGWRRARKGD